MIEILVFLSAALALSWLPLVLVIVVCLWGVGLSWFASRLQRSDRLPNSATIGGFLILFIAIALTGYLVSDGTAGEYFKYELFTWATFKALLLYLAAGVVYSVLIELPYGIIEQKRSLKSKWASFLGTSLVENLGRTSNKDWYSKEVSKLISQPTRNFLKVENPGEALANAVKEIALEGQENDVNLRNDLQQVGFLHSALDRAWRHLARSNCICSDQGYLQAGLLNSTTFLPMVSVNKGTMSAMIAGYTLIWPVAVVDFIIGDLIEIIVKKVSSVVAYVVMLCVTKPFQKMFKDLLN